MPSPSDTGRPAAEQAPEAEQYPAVPLPRTEATAAATTRDADEAPPGFEPV